jgi:hypothetical protein
MRRALFLLPIALLFCSSPAHAVSGYTFRATANANTLAVGDDYSIGGTFSDVDNASNTYGDVTVTASLLSQSTVVLNLGTTRTNQTSKVWTITSKIPTTLTPGTYVVQLQGVRDSGGSATSLNNNLTITAAATGSTSGETTTGTTSGTTDTGAGIQIPNPISCNDVNCVLTQIIKYVLGSIAILATLMFVWGGVLMLTSAGNEKRITQGRETIAWAAIGIVVILLSWSIVKFVLTSLVAKR